MDNNLSSMLYALNTFRQGTRIDKDSLVNGKIVIYSDSAADANTGLANVTGLLTAAYPNPNDYELLDVTFSGGDGGTCWTCITIRVK
jgi:hypothetical protein